MQIYGLIGNPLGHSLSEKYFTDKFTSNHIEASYKLFPLESIDDLPALIHSTNDLAGLNVTIPYKTAAIHHIQHIDKDARMVGAINTIKIEKKNSRQVLIGYNTDIYGFEQCIRPYIQAKHIVKALILGTGGAAKAVQFVLRKMGIGYTLVSRNGLKVGQLPYSLVTSSVIKTHLIIINATPIGMFPNVDAKPDILYQYIGSDHILIDLIYNPEETLFMKIGRMAGAQTINGMVMFEKQAEESWRIWNK